jgi:hypothetical protein
MGQLTVEYWPLVADLLTTIAPDGAEVLLAASATGNIEARIERTSMLMKRKTNSVKNVMNE